MGYESRVYICQKHNLNSGKYDGYWRAEIFKQTLKQAMDYINGDSLYIVHMGY